MRVKVDVIAEKHRLSVKGEVPISIRFTQNKKRKYIRIGISLKIEYWDEIRNKPKMNCPNADYIENIITEKLAKYQKQILEFQSTGKIYSLNQLIDAVEKPVKNISVEEYLNSIINSFIKQDRVGNASHYQALFNSLHTFTKLSQLQFVDIDLPFLNKYEASLREKGNKGNTINIKMRTLKATYNKAIKANIVNAEYYPFNDYNVSKLKEKTPKRAISKNDMLRVVDFDVKTITKRPHSLMQFSKDLFLFSYLGCGINMVDMAHLKKGDIIANRVTYKRHKTGRFISFMLQSHAKEIIEKYESISSNDYIFPILDDFIHSTPEQQFRRVKKVTYVANKNLKKIGEAIGLPIPLTTYVSRHSYATVLKNSGVNIALISETLGHSDLKTTQIYLDSFENEQIDEAMKNLL